MYSVKHLALHSRGFALVATMAALLSLSACGDKQPPIDSGAEAPPAVTAKDQAADPVIEANPLRDAYFGETHLHTAYSLDAYIGGARLTPDDAYRFAKGEEMIVNGRKHRISEPLDFAAVTDHAEYLGEMYSTMNEGAPGYDQELLKELRGLSEFEEQEAWFLKYIFKEPGLLFLELRQAAQFFQQLLVVSRCPFVHGGIHLAQVFGVIGDGGKIQWFADTMLAPVDDHFFTLGKSIGIIWR